MPDHDAMLCDCKDGCAGRGIYKCRQWIAENLGPNGMAAAEFWQQQCADIERRLACLTPLEGFTIQEWHVAQVYCYLLWRDDDVRGDDATATKKWRDRLAIYEERFPDAVKKFTDYMGWDKKVS